MIDDLRRLPVRTWSLAGLAFCVLMMAVALGLEHLVGLEPCPLCILQRLAVLAAAAVFLVAAIHDPVGRAGAVIYGLLSLAAVGAGIALAGRHLWLQSLPADQVPACGPGLEYMLDVLPVAELLQQVLAGSGECAEVDRVLGLSIPVWTLAGFVMLTAAALAINLAPRAAGRR